MRNLNRRVRVILGDEIMTNWRSIARLYDGKDILLAVHLDYGRDNLNLNLNKEVDLIRGMNFPIVEVVNGRDCLPGDNVSNFPSLDELKGFCFGIVYLCGSQREVCIPRMESCLKNNSRKIVRLEKLIH